VVFEHCPWSDPDDYSMGCSLPEFSKKKGGLCPSFRKKGWTLPEFSKKRVDFAREFEAKKPPLHLKGSSLRGTLQFANRERMPIGSSFFRASGESFEHNTVFLRF